MANQVINIGSAANDGTGDPLRSAFDKINDNFLEIYTELGGSDLAANNLLLAANTISSTDTNGNINLSPNGTGAVTVATGNKLKLIDHTDLGIVTLDADGNLSHSATFKYDATTLTLDNGFTINSSTGTLATITNGDITLDPHGTGSVISDGDIKSSGNETHSLGSSANKWLTVFANRINASRTGLTGTAPASSIGAAGDIAGDVVVDTTHVYVCTAAHDGSTNIWSRVALDATPF